MKSRARALVVELLHENGTRSIDTGLTGPVNHDILDSVMGQLSDGKWENVPMMAKYWRNAHIADEGGKVVIVIDDSRWDSGFRGKDDKWIKNWFAGKIKEIVYDEMGGSQWNRADRTQLDYLTRSRENPITVRDAYQAYEILKGRNIRNRYAEPEPAVAPAQESEESDGLCCSQCNGSGEGRYEGSRCTKCGGSGDEHHPWGKKEDDREWDDHLER